MGEDKERAWPGGAERRGGKRSGEEIKLGLGFAIFQFFLNIKPFLLKITSFYNKKFERTFLKA